MSNYKRTNPDRDITFRKPHSDCYACYDTGIVQNGDGLLNDYLPDYDLGPDGNLRRGHDLALICHCKAAYGEQDREGKSIRGAFRLDGGNVARTADDGRFPSVWIGSDIDRSVTDALHKRRLANWKEGERLMNIARQKAASGDPDALPEFMLAARKQLKPSTWVTTRTRASTVGDVLKGVFANIERNHLGDYEPPNIAVSSPRDFIPATGPTPAQAPPLPLTLEQPPAPIDEEYGF
jgi:hypothetical protein